jgi:hypothetical protein
MSQRQTSLDTNVSAHRNTHRGSRQRQCTPTMPPAIQHSTTLYTRRWNDSVETNEIRLVYQRVHKIKPSFESVCVIPHRDSLKLLDNKVQGKRLIYLQS